MIFLANNYKMSDLLLTKTA